MKACILGSTGLIGGHLLEILSDDSDFIQVSSFSRNLPNIQNQKIKLVKVDFRNLEETISDWNFDIVFCAMGTTIKKAGSREKFWEVDHDFVLNSARMARKANVPRFSVVTALGADSGSLIFYNKVKGEIENQLKSLDFSALSIFRPSLLIGDRKETRPGEKIGEVLMGALSFALIGPFQKYKAITGLKVAQAMVWDAKTNRSGIKIYESDEIWSLSETKSL